MSKIDRRTMLKGVAAAVIPATPVAAAAPKENPKNLPVIIIDGKGDIANDQELFKGVPWKCLPSTALYGPNCPLIENDIRIGTPKRSIIAWLPRAHALVKGKHFVWGEVRIKEEVRIFTGDWTNNCAIRAYAGQHQQQFWVNPNQVDPSHDAHVDIYIKPSKGSCREAFKRANEEIIKQYKVKDIL